MLCIQAVYRISEDKNELCDVTVTSELWSQSFRVFILKSQLCQNKRNSIRWTNRQTSWNYNTYGCGYPCAPGFKKAKQNMLILWSILVFGHFWYCHIKQSILNAVSWNSFTIWSLWCASLLLSTSYAFIPFNKFNKKTTIVFFADSTCS